MTCEEFASRIDHTVLKPEASVADIERLCREAAEHRFASVCVPPVHVRLAASLLRGSGVLVCSVAGFPHGTSKATLKAIEASSAVKDGADEVDVVAHLPALLARDVGAAKAELLEIARAARAARRDVTLKVIVESALLSSLAGEGFADVIADACRAVREGACDFIKTSTGFHPAGGASVEAVRLMKRHADGLKVKAAGGIRDLATARAMLDAGADRLGMSASLSALDALRGEGGSR